MHQVYSENLALKSADSSLRAQHDHGHVSKVGEPVGKLQRQSQSPTGPCAPPRKSSMKLDATSGRDGPARRTGRVVFAEQAELIEMDSVLELVDDPGQLWYRDADIAKFIKHVWKNVSTVEQQQQQQQQGEEGTTVRRKKVCTRGIEKCLDPEEFREVRDMGWNSVLDRQDLQEARNGGRRCDDPEDLAIMYRVVSCVSQKRAVARAVQDAAAIRHFTKDTRREIRRFEKRQQKAAKDNSNKSPRRSRKTKQQKPKE